MGTYILSLILIAAREYVNRETNQERFIENTAIGYLVKKLRETKIEEIRKEGDVSSFKLLCEVAFAPMVSREKWKMNHMDIGIRALLTVADEAFALLTMENNVEEWIMGLKYSKEDFKSRKGKHTKYTSLGTNTNGTKKGWKIEGKMRFNDLYDAVVLERNRARAKEIEEKVKEEWKLESTGNNRRRMASERERGEDEEDERRRGEEAFVPRNGFDH